MTERNGWHGLRAASVGAFALALAGCAASHVGEDWQCPLAQGKVCASVAAADPAVPESRVPEAQGAANLIDAAPPHRRNDARAVSGTLVPGTRDAAAETDCESGCNPLAWLAGLFAGPTEPEPGEPGRADAGRDADIEDTGQADANRPMAAPAPDDEQSPAAGEAHDEAGADDASGPAEPDALRTGETVARIWIAPFVDGDGIYREGSWVRAVIAPAEWRLP